MNLPVCDCSLSFQNFSLCFGKAIFLFTFGGLGEIVKILYFKQVKIISRILEALINQFFFKCQFLNLKMIVVEEVICISVLRLWFLEIPRVSHSTDHYRFPKMKVLWVPTNQLNYNKESVMTYSLSKMIDRMGIDVPINTLLQFYLRSQLVAGSWKTLYFLLYTIN